MKKTFWGYSVHEVDENIEYLESQNVKLEKLVKQLTAELEKVKSELESASAVSESDSDNALIAQKDSVIAKNTQKITELTEENEKLKTALSTAAAVKDGSGVRSASSASFDDIGNMFKTAYADMHLTKQKAKEYIAEFLDSFWKEWNSYEKQLAALSESLKAKQQESRNSFISYADFILQSYGDIENSNSELESNISDMLGQKFKIEKHLNSLLDELDKNLDEDVNPSDTYQQSVDEQDDSSADDETQYSILNAIKARVEDKEETVSDEKPSAKDVISAAEHLHSSDKPHFDDNNEGMSISQKVNIRNII